MYLVTLLLTQEEQLLDSGSVGRVSCNHLVCLLGYRLVHALCLVQLVEYHEVLAAVEVGIVVPTGSSSINVCQQEVVGTLVAVEADCLTLMLQNEFFRYWLVLVVFNLKVAI